MMQKKMPLMREATKMASSCFDAKEALQSGSYISGTKCSGKSDLGMIHADELMKLGVTVLVFDSTRDWINRSSIPNYISITQTNLSVGN